MQDAAPGTPIFVFLSPGVDVAASVEGLGRKLGFTADTGHYSAVSLGQGQEPIAMNNLTNAHKNGGWVLLQNIHLTIDWTSGPLEKKVDKLTEGAHKDFRWARAKRSACLPLIKAYCSLKAYCRLLPMLDCNLMCITIAICVSVFNEQIL